MERSRKSSRILFALKVLHTVIWAFYALTILYILYAAIVDRIGTLLWIGVALVVVEGVILLINGGRCPLTRLAEKYTDQDDANFDIFLPKWLAENNKAIFTPVFLAAIVLVIYRVIVTRYLA